MYSYNGDKLTTLSGNQSGTSFTSAYLYDGNGNMTLDGNQTVRLSYDINNRVHSAKKTATGQNPSPSQDELTATYSYFADGTKYSIKDTDGNSRIYIGPFTLVRKDYQSASITLLESADVLGSDARFAFTASPQAVASGDTTYAIAYETLYLLKDHLGSVRVITDRLRKKPSCTVRQVQGKDAGFLGSFQSRWHQQSGSIIPFRKVAPLPAALQRKGVADGCPDKICRLWCKAIRSDNCKMERNGSKERKISFNGTLYLL